ncbi:glycosyltransferase family 2 protein [Paenibacillus tianjinensis]|uniref:Glycosyltransferase family 2 protein n=1 Tax=Paenibacillus tianjinensis TaxID=2810347 RepID=A0ABX7L9R5_9BACL|nr:glycosyltransferase family 2 protein [Paenibacillus tianjinensis]QSF44111.1 glycosyltransferase family 2 protein [Paenibacillus tianjinensis]
MTDSDLNYSNVCIVIVTFNPNIIELRASIENLKENKLNVCIVDNSIEDEIQRAVKLFKSFSQIITLGENKGIAEAQNHGMNWAFSNGFKAVLLLDQDSYINKKLLDDLCSSYNYLSKEEIKVACVGPLTYNRDKTERDLYTKKRRNSGMNLMKVDKTLSSGSLIAKETYQIIGGMEVGLFIDLVDWEWCWRAREKGYETYIIADSIMAHRLGEGRRELAGFGIGIPSPIRHYYQFRNTLLLFKRSYVPIKFKIKYSLVLIFKFFYFPLFVSPRKERLKWITKGVVDFIIGKTGSI